MNTGTVSQQKRNRHSSRYRQIVAVLVKHRLNEVIRTFGLDRFLPLHMIPPAYPWRADGHTNSQRVRMALEELGTTFVKVGQILSTRTDILPSDFTQELTKLQDSMPPFPPAVIEKAIADELGRPVREIFATFDPDPVGVASIGQVHAATLPDGTEVVVKVDKPGVLDQVKEDLEILRQIAASAAKRNRGLSEYDLTMLVEEIADTLMGELDYIREGHSAEHFARFFQEDPSIHIPKVFWEYTTPQVITLERIRGIGILDVAALDKAGFDRKELARRSVDIWVKMVFEGTVFHADPHPGNLLVESDGRLGLMDFGMIGSIDDEVREGLISAVKGIMDRDVDLFIDALVELGAMVVFTSRGNFRRDLRHIMGHYPDAASRPSMAFNLGELMTVVRRNRVQLPANTFLLLKAMAMAQSLGRSLDRDFNFFDVVRPHVEQTVRRRYAPSTILRRLPSAAAELAVFSAGLPRRLDRVVKSVERGEFQVRADVSGLDEYIRRIERMVNRAIIGVLLASLIISLALTGYLGYLLRIILPHIKP